MSQVTVEHLAVLVYGDRDESIWHTFRYGALHEDLSNT